MARQTALKNHRDGATTRQQDQSIAPSEYQEKLDLGLPTFQLHAADVRYWSDFNRVFYHPRSIVQLNEYELNSQLMPFENWSAGDELFQTLDKEFDLIDRDVRPFVEECDQMQGLQLMTGTDDAWGGFAAKYLDNLRDEYGKTCIWVWGIEDGTRTVRACWTPSISRPANADASSTNNCNGRAIRRDLSELLKRKHQLISDWRRRRPSFLNMSILRGRAIGSEALSSARLWNQARYPRA